MAAGQAYLRHFLTGAGLASALAGLSILAWNDHMKRSFVDMKPKTAEERAAKPLYPETLHWPYPGDEKEREAYLATLRTLNPAFDRGKAGKDERNEHANQQGWDRMRAETIQHLISTGVISSAEEVMFPVKSGKP